MSWLAAWRMRRLATLGAVAFCKRLRWHGFEHVHTARAVAPAVLWLIDPRGAPALALRALALYCPPVRGMDERGGTEVLTRDDVIAHLRAGTDVAITEGAAHAPVAWAREARVAIVPVVARLGSGGGLDVRLAAPIPPAREGDAER